MDPIAPLPESEPERGPADGAHFLRLAEAHRRELLVHCYRMLGSLLDAEDAVQETVLRAWRGLGRFEGRGTERAWLHAIATRVCLDALERSRRRILPSDYGPAASRPDEAPRHVEEPIWLEPFPDAWLPGRDDPEARVGERESVALAFLAAIQRLPARQRAALLLRDVLGWTAGEVAELLTTSVAAVNGAVQRAREALEAEGGGGLRVDPPDAAQARLLERWVRAWEAGDPKAVTALLAEDCALSMPPDVLWFRGREAVGAFLAGGPLAGEARGRWRLVPAAANGQPAFGLLERDRGGEGTYGPLAVMVLAVRGGKVAEVTGFLDRRLFRRFGVPEVLR